MKFFNKKEDVLEIKLTQYGKHKLSLGELNPTYYAFDDDVLYDARYAGDEEEDQGMFRTESKNTITKSSACLFWSRISGCKK